jgi:hypothetical protein
VARILNFVGFQAVWFAVVLGAASGRDLLGVAAALVWLALHVSLSPRRAVELRTILLVTAAGVLVDQAAVAAGVQVFDPRAPRLGQVPLWIAALWAAFATTLRSSLGWLQGRFALAAVLGALFGPVAYLGAEGLGAVAIGGPARVVSLALLAIEWGAMMPLAAWIAAADGRAPGVQPSRPSSPSRSASVGGRSPR